MNKFLLASLGLAITLSGVTFDASAWGFWSRSSTPVAQTTSDAQPTPDTQSTVTASVNLVDAEARLLSLGKMPYDKLVATNLVDKEVALQELLVTARKRTGLVGTTLTVVCIAGLVAAHQKGYKLSDVNLKPLLKSAGEAVTSFGSSLRNGWASLRGTSLRGTSAPVVSTFRPDLALLN